MVYVLNVEGDIWVYFLDMVGVHDIRDVVVVRGGAVSGGMWSVVSHGWSVVGSR